MRPTWTAEAAAADVYADIAAYQQSGGQALAEPRILSVAAVSGRNVPKQEFGCCEPANSVRWIIHAQGTFFNDHGGPAPGRRFFGTDGWYLFDDTGDDIGFAFNEVPADLSGHLAGDSTAGCTWLVDESGVNWQVDWPTGWDSAVDTDGNVVLRLAGQQAAIAGSEVGVIGSEVDPQVTCPAATKRFAATAIVYYSFGPEN